MLINTNYPQVPIATSNVATDLARTDNQQRPPIIPPQEPTKGHEERAFNPQHERAPAHSIAEKQQQQSAKQQSQEQGAQQQAAKHNPLVAKAQAQARALKANRNAPALQRKDIFVANQNPQSQQKAPAQRQLNSQNLRGQSPQVIKQLAQHVQSFYQQQTVTSLPANISATI
ncbi:hypothetical protein G3R49_16295 [Shewanella sp. WXL01]|uniref:hypothetical protein n=1 Tax=Shewanella sp. WXL01 TaxID=2709721 RepID=UPI0014383F6E|nr:hypothetical protein [Shewanella sp. WXL01]NKF52125.1 hypothetical protein [Shewanella sp. WXL01]